MSLGKQSEKTVKLRAVRLNTSGPIGIGCISGQNTRETEDDSMETDLNWLLIDQRISRPSSEKLLTVVDGDGHRALHGETEQPQLVPSLLMKTSMLSWRHHPQDFIHLNGFPMAPLPQTLTHSVRDWVSAWVWEGQTVEDHTSWIAMSNFAFGHCCFC